jgi:hypothetical protein
MDVNEQKKEKYRELSWGIETGRMEKELNLRSRQEYK